MDLNHRPLPYQLNQGGRRATAAEVETGARSGLEQMAAGPAVVFWCCRPLLYRDGADDLDALAQMSEGLFPEAR